MQATLEATNAYQIGTVSSLTGIDAHTLRAWERRYGAIKPNRSESGRRQYDDRTVERLQLLKALVDCNVAIGQVAHLSDGALRDRLSRLAEHQSATGPASHQQDAHRHPRVAVLSEAVAQQLAANASAFSGLDLSVHAEGVDAFLEAARTRSWDVVILDLERSRPIAAPTIRALRDLPGEPGVLVVYRFATNATLAKLGRAGAVANRGPLRLSALRKAVDDLVVIRLAQRAAGEPAPLRIPIEEAPAVPLARRFDDDQLARLLEISTTIDCECPNHLSSLVSALVSFEQYSRDCESRDAEDAAQHRRLAEGTAEARSRMESLLADLCEHEGISV